MGSGDETTASPQFLGTFPGDFPTYPCSAFVHAFLDRLRSYMMSEEEDSSTEIATESEGEDSNEEITTDSEGEDSNAEIATDSEGEDSNEEITTDSEGEDSNEEITTDSEGEDSNTENLETDSEGEDSNKEIATDSEGEDSNEEIATDSEGGDSNAEVATSTENEDSGRDEEVNEENYQQSNDSDDSDDSDEEEESPEYQSLCQHSSQLLRVISNPENFAKRLFSAHIISGRVLSDIQKRRWARRRVSGSSDKRTKKLLKIVKNLIQADPGKFESLLEVMSEYSLAMAEMAVKLRRKCGRLSFAVMLYNIPTLGDCIAFVSLVPRLSP